MTESTQDPIEFFRFRTAGGGWQDVKLAAPDQLKSGSSILIDMNSFADIANYSNLFLSNLNQDSALFRNRLNSIDSETRDTARQLLNVFSYFVCFDNILIDARAVMTFKFGHLMLQSLAEAGLIDAVSLINFPPESYLAAAVYISKINERLREASATKSQDHRNYLRSTLGIGTDISGDHDGISKEICDWNYQNENIQSSLTRPFCSNVGNTGQSAERLFVYFELANQLDVPAGLSPMKYDLANALGAKLPQVMEDIMVGRKRAQPSIAQVQELVSSTALAKTSDRNADKGLPPLSGRILTIAHERRLSVLLATAWLRHSPGAEAFRKWLWAKRLQFRASLASDALKLSELETSLRKIGEQIAREGDPHGILFNRTEITFSLSNVPLLAHLIKALGIPEIELPLKLVTRNRVAAYEIFIAEWFSSTTTPLA